MPNSKLVPFVMYLDPDEIEDREAIKYLQKRQKRHKASTEIREGYLLYRRLVKTGQLALNATDKATNHVSHDKQESTDVSKVVQEARGIFIKPRREK